MAVPQQYAALVEAALIRGDPAVEEQLRQALVELKRVGDGVGIGWVCLSLAMIAHRRGTPASAAELLDQGVAAVGADDRLVLAKLLNQRAGIMIEVDEWAGAIAPLIAVSRMVDEFPHEAARAQQNLAFCLLGLRDFDGAKARFRATLPLTASRNGSLHAFSLYGLGLACLASGEADEVRRELLPALERCVDATPIGVAMVRGLVAVIRAELALADERWADLLAVVDHSGEDVRHLGISDSARMAKLGSRAAEALGDRRDARRRIDEALAIPLGPDERFEVLKVAAELARRDGDLVRAVGWLQEATALARDDGRAGRTVAQVMERAADGIHQREVELAAANEALNRAYQAVERGRLQLEERVAERTAQLAEEVAVRRRAEERAIRSSDAKSRLLAHMSHELRTPLNVIIGYSELIAETAAEEHLDDLATITRSGRHLLQLIDRVLELTRLEAGQERVEVGTVDVDRLLDEVAAEIEPSVRARSNVLVREGRGLGTFATDPARLRTILVHLLDNARRFTQGGTVALGGRRCGDRLEVWVADTGLGIADELLPRLFEPFEGAGGGAGVGLAICRQLAASLGGQITVQSSPGRGARFTVRLIEGANRAG